MSSDSSSEEYSSSETVVPASSETSTNTGTTVIAAGYISENEFDDASGNEIDDASGNEVDNASGNEFDDSSENAEDDDEDINESPFEEFPEHVGEESPIEWFSSDMESHVSATSSDLMAVSDFGFEEEEVEILIVDAEPWIPLTSNHYVWADVIEQEEALADLHTTIVVWQLVTLFCFLLEPPQNPNMN